MKQKAIIIIFLILTIIGVFYIFNKKEESKNYNYFKNDL